MMELTAANDNQPIRYGPWPTTRQIALKLGSKYYFTGIPCKHGHVDVRKTKRRMCAECDRLADIKYRANFPDRKRATYVAWRDLNRDRIRANDSRRRQSDLDFYAQKSRDRRAALERQSSGTHTLADVQDIMRIQQYKCAYCGVSIRERKHVDHIVPIAKGGSNGRENLQVLCPSCNLQKQAQDPLVFARKRGLLL